MDHITIYVANATSFLQKSLAGCRHVSHFHVSPKHYNQ
jgi:hypothetical protein